jgi:hypothetical protein
LLEEALARTEGDADLALKAAKAVEKALASVRAAARTGQIRDLEKALAAAGQATAALRQQAANLRDGWTFDTTQHLESGAYLSELKARTEAAGVIVYEHDGRLYAYPSLIEIAPADLSVRIDRRRERRLRPSVLSEVLKAVQSAPPRFKADAFLNVLYQAYRRHDAHDKPTGRVVPLVDLHATLTLMPDQKAAYPRQDFARDIYLLSRHPDTRTRDGYRVSLPASTGTKGRASQLLTMVKENGQREEFFGIAFHDA